MKKLLLTVGFLATTLFLSAQTVGQKMGKVVDKAIDETEIVFNQMRYGIKVGVNVSDVTNFSTSSMIGFYAGAYGRYDLERDMAIQPELLISHQGSKINEENIKETLANTYLHLPILFKYRLIQGLYLEVGPQLGFALSKDKVIKYGDNTLKAKTFDFAFAIGADYNIGKHFDLPYLDLTGRYTVGLTNVYKKKSADKNKNLVFQIGLAYIF